MANLSILGLYQFDPTIFDSFVIPTNVSKDQLIANILSECSDFSLLYPDAYTMRYLIGKWSTEKSKIWRDLYDSMHFEYNPIENYNRYEEVQRDVTTESSDTGTVSSESENSGSFTNTDTKSRTAFNSVQFAETDKIQNGGSNDDVSESSTVSSSSGSGSGSESVKTHMHGNIGVTTTTQMIKEYREVSMFSLIEVITDMFKEKFCVCVY